MKFFEYPHEMTIKHIPSHSHGLPVKVPSNYIPTPFYGYNTLKIFIFPITSHKHCRFPLSLCSAIHRAGVMFTRYSCENITLFNETNWALQKMLLNIHTIYFYVVFIIFVWDDVTLKATTETKRKNKKKTFTKNKHKAKAISWLWLSSLSFKLIISLFCH